MKTLVKWAARIYPAAWRARYAVELDALLEDVGPRGRDLWDILRGALLMHMRMTGLSFWKILACGALAGVLAAGIWSATLSDRYVSTAVMRISLAPSPPPADPQWTATLHLMEIQRAVLSRTSLSAIIQQQNLYLDERDKLPMEDVILLMRNRDLRIHPTSAAGGSAFSVEFVYRNPAAAQATVGAVVNSLIDENLHASRRADDSFTVMVLDPASLPSQPIGPNRLRMTANGLGSGLLLGVVCGAIWSVVRKQKRLTLRRIGGFALAGMSLGLIVAYLIPDKFVSIAVLHSDREDTFRTTIQNVLSDESLAVIAHRHGLFPRELSRDSMKDVARKVRESVRIENVPRRANGSRGVFVISFTYSDRLKAQHAARDLMVGFLGVPQSPTVVLDPPNLPQGPFFPNRKVIALMGTIAGIVLGVAASHLRKLAPATM